MSSQEGNPSTIPPPPPKFDPETYFNNPPSNLFDLINRLTGRTNQSIKGDTKTPPYYRRGTKGFMDFNKLSSNEAWSEKNGFDPITYINQIKEKMSQKMNIQTNLYESIKESLKQTMSAFEVPFEKLKKLSPNMFNDERVEQEEDAEDTTDKASETTLQDSSEKMYINEILHNYIFYEPNTFNRPSYDKSDYSVRNFHKVNSEFNARLHGLRSYITAFLNQENNQKEEIEKSIQIINEILSETENVSGLHKLFDYSYHPQGSIDPSDGRKTTETDQEFFKYINPANDPSAALQIMDLFNFAYDQAREYERQWCNSMSSIDKTTTYQPMTGGAFDGTDNDERYNRQNDRMVYHNPDQEGQSVQVRNIPARPNLLVLIPAIMMNVLAFITIWEAFTNIRNGFLSYHNMMQGEGVPYIPESGNETDDMSNYYLAVLYEYISNLIWNGFSNSLQRLNAVAMERMQMAASNAASASASSYTWSWNQGIGNFLINTARGTTNNNAAQAAMTQLHYEQQQAMATAAHEMNVWRDNFTMSVEQTSNSLIIGLSLFQTSTLVILNQVNPYAVNRYTVAASVGALSGVWSAGGTPYGAFLLLSQSGLTISGIRNAMLGRLDTLVQTEPVAAQPQEDPIVPQQQTLTLIEYFTGSNTEAGTHDNSTTQEQSEKTIRLNPLDMIRRDYGSSDDEDRT